MKAKRALLQSVALAGIAGCLTLLPAGLNAQVAIDADDIGGVVTGPRGPEAGVWVIAETRDLPTRMSKMVVTEPGKQLNLTAVVAPDEKAAAEYYPAIYWYSMIKVPEASSFPGTGPT